jgi:hypothetical protein
MQTEQAPRRWSLRHHRRKHDSGVERFADGLVRYWIIGGTLIGLLWAGIGLYFQVKAVIKKQDEFDASSEVRRNYLRDQSERDHIAIAVSECNIEWLKELRKERKGK